MIGNLKAGADSAESDIGQVIYRMKMLGFNAIRLPFTFAALAQVTPCNPHSFDRLPQQVPQASHVYRAIIWAQQSIYVHQPH